MTEEHVDNLTEANIFNSHPHKEDDGYWKKYKTAYNIFNSHPHKEDDIMKQLDLRRYQFFNSHPHKEDDKSFSANAALTSSFQLTSSQGG